MATDLSAWVAFWGFMGSWPWPVATAAVAFLFRKPLADKIGSLTEASFQGAKFALPEQVANQKTNAISLPAPTESSLGKIALAPTPSPLIADLERTLLAQLNSIGADDRQPLLVRRLAEAQVMAQFERAFSDIFASQIALLKDIQRAGGNFSLAQAEQQFSELQKVWPDVHGAYTVRDWLRYLESFYFISTNGSSL